jgi:hypothetical protein
VISSIYGCVTSGCGQQADPFKDQWAAWQQPQSSPLLLLLLLLQGDELDALNYDDLAAIAKLTADPHYLDVMTVRLLKISSCQAVARACALHKHRHRMSTVSPG